MKNLICIFILLLSHQVHANISIPVGETMLSLKLPTGYHLEKKCEGITNLICYQIWNQENYLSLSIIKLKNKKSVLNGVSGICGKKVKENKHHFEYCKKPKEVLFIKNDFLITIGLKSSSNVNLLKTIVDELK